MTGAEGGRSPASIATSLGGLNFPADKHELIRHAAEHGAGDEVLKVLRHIPERDYRNMADVMQGVGQAEAAH